MSNINNIQLQTLTELDLLELRSKINEELKTYQDRSKVLVYTIDQEFGEHAYFLKKENALALLSELIEDDEVFETKIVLNTKYLTDSEVQSWCRDYER